MQHYIYFCNIQMKHMNIHLKRIKHTVATCDHLLAASNGLSFTRSLMLAWSSMLRCGGRTSAVRESGREARGVAERSARRK